MADSTKEDEQANPSDSSSSQPVAPIEEAATGTAEQPDIAPEIAASFAPSRKASVIVLLCGVVGSLFVFARVEPQWQEQKTTYNVQEDDDGRLTYMFKGEATVVDDVVAYEDSPIRQDALDDLTGDPADGKPVGSSNRSSSREAKQNATPCWKLDSILVGGHCYRSRSRSDCAC